MILTESGSTTFSIIRTKSSFLTLTIQCRDVPLQVWVFILCYQPQSFISERSEDCDKNLVQHIEDLYLHFLAQMEKKSAKEEKEKEATADFRKKGRF